MKLSTLLLPVLLSLGPVPAVHAEEGTGSSLNPPGLKPLINRANALLSSGQFNDAARAYSDAIDQTPSDYLLYYKRATAYYSLSRHPLALADFTRVLELTSGSFDAALLASARIHVKDGHFPLARSALSSYSAKQPSSREASELLLAVKEGEIAAGKSDQARRSQLWTACAEAAGLALMTASHSAELRERRADCALRAGDVELAVGDLTRLTHLSTPSTTLYMRIFRLSFFLLPHSSDSSTSPALSILKQCLRHDPDSKPCKAAHRLLKQLDKKFIALDTKMGAEDWRGALEIVVGAPSAAGAFPALPGTGLYTAYEDALKEHIHALEKEAAAAGTAAGVEGAARKSPSKNHLLRAACKAYTKTNAVRAGEAWCRALLSMEGEERDATALVGLGEALLIAEEYEEAVRVFERAFEASGRSDRDIMQRVQKAQKLLKQSRQKDYYKVLGVARDADTRTIKKAFRKAAMKAHPDKGGSEAKMAAVNEAYEVLSNPELRQRFDNGDDPNDPNPQHHPFGGGGGGNPFAHFFQQGGGPGGGSFFQHQGGGGGGFQFHFQHPGGH